MKYIKLDECCTKITDYVASGSFASLKENVLITKEPNYALMVKTADFANGFSKDLTYTDKHGYDFLSNSNLFGGELILSNIGSIGKVFIVPNLGLPMTLASNSIMVKPNTNYRNRYLYYYFLSSYGQNSLKKISSGTSMQKFNKTMLKTILIQDRSIDNQDIVISSLDKINEALTTKTEELHNLDELVKSRFIEMFGDPIINDKDWEVLPLNELTDVRDGTHDSPKYVEIGYPFITSKNITNGVIDFSTAQYISEKDYLHFEDRSHVDNGDILMPMIGTIGGAVIVKKDRDFSIKNVALIKFNKNNDAENVFIQAVLNSHEMKDYFATLKTGGTQKFIGLGMIRNLPIINPPHQLQKEYISFVESIDKSKFIIQKQIEDLQELLDSKMDEYFG